MLHNKCILIIFLHVLVVYNLSYAQKNDNIRDLEKSLNKTDGMEKLVNLNILTKYYKSTNDQQKLNKYSKQGSTLAEQVYDAKKHKTVVQRVQ